MVAYLGKLRGMTLLGERRMPAALEMDSMARSREKAGLERP